jgi:hypothetical protein
MGYIGFGHPNEANVFCFLSSLSLLPPATTTVFGSYLSSLYSKPNTASPVWICLLERFRGSQKQDDRGPLSIQSLWATLNLNLSPNFLTLKEPRNRFQGIKSASLCSLAGRYDNPIPTRFLAPIDCLKFQH